MIRLKPRLYFVIIIAGLFLQETMVSRTIPTYPRLVVQTALPIKQQLINNTLDVTSSDFQKNATAFFGKLYREGIVFKWFSIHFLFRYTS